ncbi:hypothetical protein [Mucilaginibacter psychrotolerans]|uniref:Uncharacterized protein n=1 Tax=Mucilaginibacter psychrotolerans TaxID=1524096 RepID=A0A4Y8SPU5_9SPHI|nr:hypothetical protein [Mucilaginibacter psychrotolerans]TFF40928.1 hypothetical protein E2R66_01765 [Mucilaginibacter psychrotolerans]
MHTIKRIFAAKTLYWHLLIRLVLFCFCVGIGYIFVAPLICWSILGEGAVGDRIANEPLNAFLFEYGTLIIALFTIAILTGLNIKNRKFSEAKSYVITMVIVIILYYFRDPVLYLIF